MAVFNPYGMNPAPAPTAPAPTTQPNVSSYFKTPAQKITTPFPSTTTSGSTTPFVINGLKAAQPGGLQTPSTTAIKPAQIAKPADQQALGSQTYVPGTTTIDRTAGATPGYNTGAGTPAQVNTNLYPSNGAPGTNSQPSTPTAPGLLATVAGFSNPDAGLSDLYSRQQNLSGQLASMTGQIINTPSDLNFQTGRLNALQNSYNSAESNLASTYQANLAQRGQNIGAAENALGTATQLQQSPYGVPLVNPATGQSISGGQPTGSGSQLDPQTQATNLAKQVMSGQLTYDQAISSLGYAGNVGTTFLNNAITSSGGNPLQLQAQGTATQQNVQTQGTTQTQIGSQGLGQATQSYTNATTFNNTAVNQAQVLKNVLDSTGINSANSSDWNNAVNNLQGRMGSTNYSQFVTALNELQNSYSQLLSTGGGTPTQNDATALATLNPNSSAAQINASIDTLKADANAKLSSLYSNVNTYQGILNGGSTQSPTGSGSVSAGGYTFVQDSSGNWVVK